MRSNCKLLLGFSRVKVASITECCTATCSHASELNETASHKPNMTNALQYDICTKHMFLNMILVSAYRVLLEANGCMSRQFNYIPPKQIG